MSCLTKAYVHINPSTFEQWDVYRQVLEVDGCQVEAQSGPCLHTGSFRCDASAEFTGVVRRMEMEDSDNPSVGQVSFDRLVEMLQNKKRIPVLEIDFGAQTHVASVVGVNTAGGIKTVIIEDPNPHRGHMERPYDDLVNTYSTEDHGTWIATHFPLRKP